MKSQKPNSERTRLRHRTTGASAFTMIEIAISLAVIGFALVAIIGILPFGMEVQRDNREQTIIDADSQTFLSAMTGGSEGLDYLTNYVIGITNTRTLFNELGQPQGTTVVGYGGYPNLGCSGLANPLLLTNGAIIMGLLNTPNFVLAHPFPKPTGPPTSLQYYSNHIIAYFRSLTGGAAEKAPQNNQAMLDSAFSYRFIVDISDAASTPYTNYPAYGYDRDWTNYTLYAVGSDAYNQRLAYSMVQSNLQRNIHEIRLLFRWPLLARGNTGNGRQVFRSTATGSIVSTNWLNLDPAEPGNYLYFFQPQTYVNAN